MMFQPSPKKNPGKLYETKQQYEELINCQICYCRANQPTLCPHCSKVYCEVCITTSLKMKSQCPNCRKVIKGQLTHCSRFINQLSSIVNLIFQSAQESQKCKDHGINLNYFCEDCHKSACCECKMFGEHQTHRFKPISLVYEAKYETIRDLLSELKNRIIKKEATLTEMENHLISVKAKAEANITEIQDYTERYRNKIINQNINNDEEYENIEQLVNQSKELCQIKETLLNQLQHAKKVNCYKFDEQIFEKLQALLLKNQHRYESSKNISVIEQAIPPFQKYKVVVANCLTRMKQSEPFYSQLVLYQESQWRVVLYPKGSTNPQYISIFLELIHNPDSLNLYVYQIEVIHPSDQKLNIMKEHHSKFNINQCWGYGKFMKVDELSQFISKEDDTLTITFSIKFCNYSDLYQRRQLILDQLSQELQIQSQRVEVLEYELGKQSLNSIDLQ